MIILYYGSTGGITACVSSTESRAGTYQPNTGQTSCITATSGNYGSSSGATSQSHQVLVQQVNHNGQLIVIAETVKKPHVQV